MRWKPSGSTWSRNRRMNSSAARVMVFVPVVVAVVLPAERHVAVVDGKEPMIRDRDPVGVPAHVVQDLPGSTEGRLGVDHPVGRAHRREVLGKRLAIAQGLKRRRKAEPAGVEGLLQILEEQAAE